MTDTNTLIDSLSGAATPAARISSPVYYSIRLVLVLAVYALGTQLFLGLRPDLAMQFTRPWFVAEIALLVALLFSSVGASVLSMYPDAYQKPRLLTLPYMLFALLCCMIGLQILLVPDPRMALPVAGLHCIECTICIGAVAVLPTALIFALQRSGASVEPEKSGTFTALAASAVGCLTLRLAEENDSLTHLAGWHYLPIVLFAALGARIGKSLLKW